MKRDSDGYTKYKNNILQYPVYIYIYIFHFKQFKVKTITSFYFKNQEEIPQILRKARKTSKLNESKYFPFKRESDLPQRNPKSSLREA